MFIEKSKWHNEITDKKNMLCIKKKCTCSLKSFIKNKKLLYFKQLLW